MINTVGSLRSPVTVYIRQQVADPAGTGIIETLDTQITCAADIQPIGTIAFYTAINTDELGTKPYSHNIYMRWQRYLDLAYLIVRMMGMPDGGSRTENYRVRRYVEIEGKVRFIRCECQLENVVFTD